MNNINFNPSVEENIYEDTRLVIYDYESSKFCLFKEIPSNDTFELSKDFFNSHWDYKYKYQVKNKENRWIDKIKYKRLLPEIQNEDGLKYLFFPEETSDTLIVIFQAINTTPSYNYIRTLRDIKVNKLFIKDDYGRDSRTRSSYYLGFQKDMVIANATQKLIKTIVKDNYISKDKTIFVGSSKGGFASIYHGYKFGAFAIIAGGPQILLGNYLYGTEDDETVGVPIFRSVIGELTEENRIWGNNLILNVLKTNEYSNPNTFIHVGYWEPHYKNHIVPFMEMTKKLGVKNIELNILDYSKHTELATHFPDFLKNKVKEVMNKI